MEQLIVNLTEANRKALIAAAGLRGDTLTDTVNRALAVYEKVTALEADGAVLHAQMPDGSDLRLLII